jgi:hypothetical protein
MTVEPRTRHDYGERETRAAHRVLVDLGQVLGSWFKDSIVVVGGWVPDLLVHDPGEVHVGSIDVDLALDAEKLREGRYAEIVKSLLATGRYTQTKKPFRLRATVELGDGGPAVVVDVDFLKTFEKRRNRRGPRLAPGFRPLDADGCAAAFRQPALVPIDGHTISGAENRVQVLVASVADFLVMKSYALAGRDKPKDAYDICYCLDHAEGGIEPLAHSWRERRPDPLVEGAIKHLREKFSSVTAYGAQQVAAFYDATTREERELRARRAFELVARFLEILG